MKKRLLDLLLLALLLMATDAMAFTKGMNQAWFKSLYGYQWLDGHYNKTYAEEVLVLNKKAGSELLRMWLFEGSSLTQFAVNSKSNDFKLRKDFLVNLKNFLLLARKHKVKISLTFLDGNAFQNLQDDPEKQRFWWNVFNNKYGMQERFYEQAIAPIYQLVKKEFADVVTQFDLVNEVNALTEFKLFADEKEAMSQFLCRLGKGSPAPITASLGWANPEWFFFGGLMDKSCLNFYDLHFYNDLGIIPLCENFKHLAEGGAIFQLGEFGQISPAFDDELQSRLTQRFLNQAKDCGFKAALAWRLVDVREGQNSEARFSYFAFNRPRPALNVFKSFK